MGRNELRSDVNDMSNIVCSVKSNVSAAIVYSLLSVVLKTPLSSVCEENEIEK